MNYKDCCRTCLGTNKEMRKLDAVVVISGTHVQLSDILRNFYSFQTSSADVYPDNICLNCVHHLTLTHSFKILIDASTKTLQENVASSTVIDSNDKNFDVDITDYHQDSKTQILLQKTQKILIIHREEPKQHCDKIHKTQKIQNTPKILIKRKEEPKYHLDKDPEAQKCQQIQRIFIKHKKEPKYLQDKVSKTHKFQQKQKILIHHKQQEHVALIDNETDSNTKMHHSQKVSKTNELQGTQKVREFQIFCVECKSEFRSKESLKEHCIVHLKPTIGRYSCQFCLDKFPDHKELVVHRKLHQKPFLCHACWDGFYSESEFTEHECYPKPLLRINPEQMIQCEHCGKSYQKDYIKFHVAIHGNDLKFSCDYCPKKFKLANMRDSHVKFNHTRERNHKCNFCEAAFINAGCKSSHMRSVHLKEKKHACETCSKRFFSRNELGKHMLKHTGLKAFQCHLCGKAYQVKFGLKVHLKSHAKVTGVVQS